MRRVQRYGILKLMKCYLITVEVASPNKALDLRHFTFYFLGAHVSEQELCLKFMESIKDISGDKTIKQVTELTPKQYGNYFVTQLKDYVGSSSEE